MTSTCIKSTRTFARRLNPIMRAGINALALVALAAGASSVKAQTIASPWATGNLAQARLLAATFDGKSWQAGVEVRLKGHAHTYWRQPGDGGVPPVFDFSKSTNIAEAKVLFPAPVRGGKKGEEFIGYEKVVVFPVQIVPVNGAKAVNVDLTLNYAACEKICVPELAKLRLSLTPGRSDAIAASMIARFSALLPKSLDAPGAPKLAITPLEPGRRWRVTVKDASIKAADLFIEADEGWYFDTMKKPDAFEIVLAQKPEKPALLPKPFLTLTSDRGAFEGAYALP